MYVRVTHVQAPEPGRIREGLEGWYRTVLPMTKVREGFLGVVSLVNWQTGRALSLTIWDGDEDRLASVEAEYHKKAIARFGEFFTGAHAPEDFELNLCEGPLFSEPHYADSAREILADSV